MPCLRSTRFLCAIITGFGLLSLNTGITRADNWPSWRGPNGTGISSETALPLEWSKSKNVAWRLKLPGSAGATPAIWNDHIFLTSAVDDRLIALCVSTDGTEKWRQTVASGNQAVRKDEGNYASPSPVTDGEHVWITMATGHVVCFDFDGNPIWKTNLAERYGPFQIQFGMSSTPVLDGDRLYFQLIHGDGKAETHEAVTIAIDKRSGDEIWHAPRVTRAHTENEHSYASPMLYEAGGVKLLITHGADFTVAYNPDDGSEVWRLGGLNPHDDPKRRYHPTLRFVASTGMADGIIVCPTAKNGPVFAVRPDGHGDLTGTKSVLWVRDQNTPDVPTPLIKDGIVYLCRENGFLLTLDAATGKEIYHERTRRSNIRHRASPVLAAGHIYLTGRDGTVTVVKTGRKYEMIAQNDIGEEMSASPAIANGTFYLRTFDALWAIRK